MTGGFLDRFRSPGSRAVRDAGPTDRRVITAIVVGAVVAWALISTGGTAAPIWLVFAIVAALTTGIVAVSDRDGWTIRNALAYVALAQRGRWRGGVPPKTVPEAEAWLHNPVNANATNLERAAMLITTGRWEDAGALLDRYVPSTEIDRASWVRMQATFEGRASGQIDMDRVREAVRTLEPAEAKYQLTSASWSQTWLDISAGRPWRKRFADAARELGPFDVPARFRIWMAIQQLVAPIACVVAAVIFGVFFGT